MLLEVESISNALTGQWLIMAVMLFVALRSLELFTVFLLVRFDQEDAYKRLPPAINGGYKNDVVKNLIHMNDVERRSFSEIADYIENNL
jgi:hypothetical protein